MNISLSSITADLSKEDGLGYRKLNKILFKTLNKACVVVDDDPTGNQTVYDIPLLTRWEVDTLVNELRQSAVFFLLTNSRSLSAKEAENRYKEIGKNLLEASKIANKDISVISRSDSTLRGHFPLEPSTLKKALALKKAITVFSPVMFEGNRVTVNDTHYIKEGENLIPVSETPFAHDHSFKYTKANLKAYIEEKSGGNIRSSEVYALDLNTIREKSTAELSKQILEIPENSYCIINSLNYADLDKVSHALLQAEKLGKQIIYRTSSSFVPSYIGLSPKGLLKFADLFTGSNAYGGLTIVGSYIKKSSDQLQEALSIFDAGTAVEIDVDQVLGATSREYLKTIADRIDSNLKSAKDTLVFTSRKVITGGDATTTINIAATISNALVQMVNGLQTRPKYLIAKGGITSHDLAVKGLQMKRSKVIGQIQSGIPVWEMDAETKFPNLLYIVFPGNVGNNQTLKDVINKLK